MIHIDHVSFQYPNAEYGSLHDISLHIKRGECVLLCGPSGCGKTTLSRLINGLIPHYYDGEFSGTVTVGGTDAAESELYETARMVGSVFQNPRSQFFCVDTTGEIAFGCENLGIPPEEIICRVDNAARDMAVSDLLGRNIFSLSGGEKQKIACASVSAMQPEVFVLDEPTSNLDTEGINALRDTMRFWKSQGKTIIIAEHRLYWLGDICDRAVYLHGGKIVMDVPMNEFNSKSAEVLAEMGLRTLSLDNIPLREAQPVSGETVTLRNYRYTYRGSTDCALNIPEVLLPKGGIIAVIGRNGAGKSTLSNCLCGLAKPFRGVYARDGINHTGRQMLKKSYMVMQDVNHQLFCESVDEELRLGMNSSAEADAEQIIEGLSLQEFRKRHPMSLSGGQKQRVAIASALLAGKEILIFDEPTSGLDFSHMEQTAALLRSMRGRQTLFIITHDPELIVRCCDYVLHLDQGRIYEQYALDEDGGVRLLRYFNAEAEEERSE